jgi:hypothetical protein
VPDDQFLRPVTNIEDGRPVAWLVVHDGLLAFSVVQRVSQPPSTGTMAPCI